MAMEILSAWRLTTKPDDAKDQRINECSIKRYRYISRCLICNLDMCKGSRILIVIVLMFHKCLNFQLMTMELDLKKI